MKGGCAKFENDVKEYGIQTFGRWYIDGIWFENDVKEYGIQTIIMSLRLRA